MIDVERARLELTKKTKTQIEADTADKWASRSLAATVLALEATSKREQLKWLMEACDYEHEAAEHAGAAGVAKLQEVLDQMKEIKREIAREHTQAQATQASDEPIGDDQLGDNQSIGAEG
jgi:transposase